ncbi:metallophosphoesterase [Aliarcobacter butzleri]|uniref:metallophosphoesterase n=1 Tax=Aliarcobacter butzleri TaxID=28197 RepID=UPI003B214EC9
MKNLRIMHFSDLHYLDVSKKEIEYIRNAILYDIDNYIVKNNLVPDFLIFSGDLVFKPEENNSSINTFNNGFEFFIKPILDKLNLTNDDIFITSGNHDINRNILSRGDKNGLLSYKEEGIKSVNELITEIIDKKTELKHLMQFNQFIDTLNNNYLIFSNNLFQVYKYKFENTISIGIINLNSNILAFDDKSYGNLIIGEEQLQVAYSKIKDCDIKIANVHHCINWLSNFEQIMVKKFYYKYFNLVFFGHEHTEQPELVNFNDEDTLILNSASIFQGRNNINGYSLVDYSFSNKSAEIYIREYNNRETKFATVTFSEKDHKYKYEFEILSKSNNKKNLDLIIDDISLKLKDFIDNELLINIAKSDVYSIEKIFIEPNIYNQSEFTENESEEKEIFSVQKLINLDEIIVIKGLESSGKSTLLNFIANEYISYKTKRKRVPIILNKMNFSDELSDIVIFSKAQEFLRKFDIHLSSKILEKMFYDGDFIFLIDNIKETESNINFIEKISISEKLKNNKFIFTNNEDIYDSIDEKINEKNFKNSSNILEVFIHNLKRAKAREFFHLYFNNKFENDEFENIFKFISKLNIPLTIFNYTLIALIYENQKGNFKPVNEAYLLDIFMENLLEKLDIQKNIYFGSLGYTIMSDYLVYISKWMVENELFTIDRYDLISITSNFIKALKREKEDIKIESFIEYMEKKGIFINIENNKIRFKYNAFLEFFIAKGMIQDDDLKAIILTEENILNYKNEINYYSGLHGQDENTIIKIRDLVHKHKDFFDLVEYNDCSNINIPEISLPDDQTEIVIEQISQDKKDQLLEKNSITLRQNNNIKCLDDSSKEKVVNRVDYEKRVFELNILLMKVIRNSEKLKKPDLKTEIVKLVTSNLSKFLQKFMNELDFYKNDSLKKSDKDEEEVHHLFSIINLMISLVFMKVAQHNLATDSFITIYKEILDETKDDVLKLLITSTMIYTSNSKNLLLIDKLLDKNNDFSKNKFLMMSLFYKIYHSIKFSEIDNRFKNKLEKYLEDILINLKYKNINIPGHQFQGISKKMNIEGSRKLISEKIKKSLSEED